MKTIIISAVAAIALCFNMKAQESPAAINPTSILSESVHSSDTAKLSVKQDTSNIRIGNLEIRIINHSNRNKDTSNCDKHRKMKIVKFDGHWEGTEFGFNGFDKPDYSMYNGNEFMALNQEKSIEVNINFYKLDIGLYKSYVGLVSGAGLSFNNYRFEEPYTLRKGNQLTEPVLLDMENLSKTKLAVSYLQIPLLLEFQIPVNHNESRLFVNAGVIGGVKIGSHTKVKFGDNKDKDRNGFNINSFKYAATARIGYKRTGLFCTYNLTQLFESGKGPAVTPFTIGFSLFQ